MGDIAQSGVAGSSSPVAVYLDTFGTLAVPYTIFYLVHVPNTRLVRMALLPFAYVSAYRYFCFSGVPIRAAGWMGNELFCLVLGSATIWAISPAPPVYQPLTERSPFPYVRQSNAFRALSLMLNYHRHVGIEGSLGPFTPLRPLGKSRLGYIRYHLWNSIIHKIAWTEIIYLIYLFGHSNSFSSASPSDLRTRVQDFSGAYGVPELAVRMWASLSFMMLIHSGMALVWHFPTVLMLTTGLWNGEEFPKQMARPWLASSLTELWGKRYHQWNRDTLLLLATPFSYLPKPLYILSVFSLSALEHHLIYTLALPLSSSLYPWLLLFLGSGIGIVIERSFYRYTGHRVQGPWGRVWMWSWMVLLSGPVTEWYWALVMQTEMYGFSPRESLGAWTTYYAGWTPRPVATAI